MKHHYLLPDEYDLLITKKQELEQTMNELGEELGEVTTQSGETRHDNAGYDEAIRSMSLLVQRNKELNQIISMAQVIQKTSDNSTIRIGSHVELIINGKEASYIIGGSHTIPGRISYLSPLGQALLGKKEGNQEEIIIHNKIQHIVILKND